MHRARSGRVPHAKLLLSSGTHHPPGTLICDNVQEIANQGSSPKLSCPEFFVGGLLHQHDWLNHCPYSWTQFPTHLPSSEDDLISPDSKCQPSNHTVGLFGMALLSSWVISLALTTWFALKGPPWIAKTLQSLEKYQGYLSGVRDKNQPNSFITQHPFIYS